MAVLNLRRIPDELKRKLKAGAAERDVSLCDWVVELLERQIIFHAYAPEKAQRNTEGGASLPAPAPGVPGGGAGSPMVAGKMPEAQSMPGSYRNVRIRRSELPLAIGTPVYSEDRDGTTVTAANNGADPRPLVGYFPGDYALPIRSSLLGGSDEEFKAILIYTGSKAQSMDGAPRVRIGSGLNGGEVIERSVRQRALDAFPDFTEKDLADVEALDAFDKVLDAAMSGEPVNTTPYVPGQAQPIILKTRSSGISTLAAEILNCPDCQAAKKHAYSDSTTPGFFYTECERHRRLLHPLPVATRADGEDIRTAAGAVITREVSVEEARKIAAGYPGLEVPDVTHDTHEATNAGRPQTRRDPEREASSVQPRDQGSSASRSFELDNQGKEEPGAIRRSQDHREDHPPSAQAEELAKTIPGVMPASKLPPATPSPRLRKQTAKARKLLASSCPSCGGMNGMHQKHCRGGK